MILRMALEMAAIFSHYPESSLSPEWKKYCNEDMSMFEEAYFPFKLSKNGYCAGQHSQGV